MEGLDIHSGGITITCVGGEGERFAATGGAKLRS
jgi:hypothetical protein